MQIEVLEEKENILLNRKEIKLNLKHDSSSTPSKAELLKELVVKYSVLEENIVIDYIRTKKGLNESMAKVKIYKEKPKIKEKKVKEEKKVEAQASEAK